MADQKISALTADTSPTSDDLVPTVNDPGGTPANRKVTAGNLITKAHGLSDGIIKVASGVMTVVTAPSGALVGDTDTQTLTNKTITQPTLTLKQSAAPTPTAEGDIQWDTDDNKIKIGDGSGTKTFSDDTVNATLYQPLDADLTTIASLTATTDNFIQSKAGAWASRTPTQVTADLIAMVGDAGSGGTKGLVPAPAAGDTAANKFLKANGTWASPTGSGDVVGPASATANGVALFDGTTGKLLKGDAEIIFDTTNNQLSIGTGTAGTGNSQFGIDLGGDVNDFFGMEIQNNSAGDSASTDISISADNDGTALVGHYIDIGIEGSGFTPVAIGNIKTVSINAAGTGYSVSDILTLTAGDSNGTVTVATVNGGGGVTSVTITDNGTGYSVASGIATTGGGGSGCTINVLTLIDTTMYGANDGYVYVSGGNLIFGTDDAVPATVIKFHTNGTATASERMRITDTKVTVGLIGTTLGKLELAGSTSGSVTLQGQAVSGSTVISFPATTGTVALTSDLTNLKIASVGITIDGGGSAITTGLKGYIEVPYACTINRVTMLADVSGSIVVDIWKDTYANYPPLVGDTITASAKPTISSATKSQDSTLTGWTTSVSAGDILAFKVDSASTVTRVHLILKVTKT